LALRFPNLVKGQISQSLLTLLLERASYRVTRLGIEELFGEIKYIDLPQYLGLNLPLSLRYLPDLLVADGDLTKAFLRSLESGCSHNHLGFETIPASALDIPLNRG